VQEEGRTPPPAIGPLRLSRILRHPETATDPGAIPLKRALWWGLFAVVLLAGLVMYFKYGRLVVPLLS
jgi:hypothetical protein